MNFFVKWMNESYFDWILAIFDEKSPFFLSILHTVGTFPFRPVSMIPWLLNWIIFWIESADFFSNWIIFWIESWVKQYWIEYWMNYFWRDLNIELNQISYWTPLFSSVLFYIYSVFYIYSLLIFILCFIFIHLRSVVVLWSERQPESASWSKRQRRDVEACPTWK